MPEPTATPPSTPATPTTPPPAAPPVGAKPAPATPPAAEPPKAPPVSPQMAEVLRKEAQFRAEKKAWDEQQRDSKKKEQDRAEKEAIWKNDPEALLVAHGYTIEQAIDILAKGGANSPEGQIRAIKAQLAEKDRKEQEASDKAKADAEKAEKQRAHDQAFGYVRSEVAKLLPDDRFELCRVYHDESVESGDPTGIAGEVAALIVKRFNRDGTDITPEAALGELEAVLDRRNERLAQSKKLKARFSQTAADGQSKAGDEPDASRQTPSVPTATSKRTITIKNRDKAAAPVRLPRDSRMPSSEATRAAAANLAKLFGVQK